MASVDIESHIASSNLFRRGASAALLMTVVLCATSAWLFISPDPMIRSHVQAHPFLPFLSLFLGGVCGAATFFCWTQMQNAMTLVTRPQRPVPTPAKVVKVAPVVDLNKDADTDADVDGEHTHRGGGISLLEVILVLMIAIVVVTVAVVLSQNAQKAKLGEWLNPESVQSLKADHFGMTDSYAVWNSDLAKAGAFFAEARTLQHPVFCALTPQNTEHLLVVQKRGERTVAREITPNPAPGLCADAVKATYARARAAAGIPEPAAQ